MTLSGLRGRCDRVPSPSPSLPTAPGIPEGGPSPIPVCHRCLLPDSRSLGRDPLHKLRPRSSGSTGTGRLGPRVLRPPEAPRPAALASRPAPASLTETRCPFQSYGLLTATPSARTPASLAAATACPSQSEAGSRRAQAGLHLRARGGGRGHQQRGAHWLGRRPWSVAARAVRVRREAWAAVLAPCRPGAVPPRCLLPPASGLPRGSRDPVAMLRERQAPAGMPGLGEPSGPPGRERAPLGLRWFPPGSSRWSKSGDLTQVWGGA